MSERFEIVFNVVACILSLPALYVCVASVAFVLGVKQW